MNAWTAIQKLSEDAGLESGSNPLNRVGDTVQELRDSAFGRNYAFGVLVIEAAQTTMAGMLDFASGVARLIAPIGPLDLQGDRPVS